MALTHLDVALATLNNGSAVSMLGKFKAMGLSPEIVTADGRAVSQRYGNEVETKRRMAFTIDELITSGSNVRQTNLQISVFSIGGEDILFRLRGGSLSVDTVTDEVSGVADLFESEVAVATNFQIDSNYRVDLNPAFMQTILDGASADLKVTALVNLGGVQATLPCLLKTGSLSIDSSKAQMENVTLANAGTPSSVSGNPLLVSILTGTGAFGYSFQTSSGTGGAAVSGNALLKSTRISFDNAAIIGASHSFVGLGQPTVVRAGES